MNRSISRLLGETVMKTEIPVTPNGDPIPIGQATTSHFKDCLTIVHHYQYTELTYKTFTK